MNAMLSWRWPLAARIEGRVLGVSICLAALLWLSDGLFHIFRPEQGLGPALATVQPAGTSHELALRVLPWLLLVCSGLSLAAVLRRLARQTAATEAARGHLHSALAAIGEAVIVTDIQGRITLINPVAATLTGWDAEEALGRPLAEVVRGFDALSREPVLNPAAQALASGRSIAQTGRTLLVARDGAEYRVADAATPLRDPAGRLSGAMLVFRDRTEEVRKRGENEQSEQAHALLHAVVEQLGVPLMLATAADERIRLLSPPCRELFGIVRGHKEAQTCTAIECWLRQHSARELPPELLTPLVHALRGHTTSGLEVRCTDSAGRARHILAQGIPIRDSAGRVIAGLALFDDLTGRMPDQDEQQRLRNLERIGTLAGGIAHDFNNLLTGIFGNIELARMPLPTGHPSREPLETAHLALKRASHLTRQLLTFAKGGDPVLEAVRLQEVIGEAVQFHLSGSAIKAHLDLPDDLWPIHADKGQISQVLANLIINAKQAMPDGGNIFIRAANVTHVPANDGTGPAGDFVEIRTRDEGSGIPAHLVKKIFTPYFSTKKNGSGLGLAVVHDVIGKHHGSISVESTSSAGTTFLLALPATRSSPVLPAVDQSAPSRASSGRVLLMDDEHLVRQVLAAMLKLCGYEVACAASGEEALHAYAEAACSGVPFQAVIMDLTVPGAMGGEETARHLLALDPSARIIAASGYSTSPVMVRPHQFGFAGHLIKPFQLNELENEMTRVLALQEPIAANSTTSPCNSTEIIP